MTATRTADERPVDAVAAGPGLRVGDCPGGRYLLTRFIAAGGMGEVFEAEDRLLGTSVAIKTIRPAIAGDERAVARFRREVLLARRVTHRNVCRVFELAHEDAPFLVMELLRGETLAARIARAGRMAPDEALAIAVQLAAALDAAHAAGVLHRDFKASNVVLADRAVVTDFGLARPDDPDDPAGPHDGGMSGTPSSMAPEQLAGRPTSPATDVYAFGLVIFEMLTGAPPFAGVRRADEPAPSARARVPGLAPQWDAVLARCLAIDPAARPRRAGDAIAALTRRRPTAALAWLAGAAGAALVAAWALVGGPAAAVDEPPRPGVLAIGDRFQRGWDEFYAHIEANRLVEARATLDGLRERPFAGDEDIRYDMLEAEYANLMGDYRSTQAWAARATDKARQRGSVLLTGAMNQQQGALYQLGEPQRAQALLDEVRAAQAEAGDTYWLMQTYASVANMAIDRGELAEGRRMYTERMAYFAPRGPQATGVSRTRLLEIELRRGWLDEAERLLDSLADMRDAEYRPNRAAYALLEGHLLAHRGELAAAEQRHVAAIEIYREYVDYQRLGAGLLALGGVRELQGDLAGAQASLEEARTIYTTLGTRRFLAEAQIGLARVALAGGQLDVADRLARTAAAEMARQGARDGESLAACVSVAVLAARGRADEAAALLAPHLARGSENAEVRARLAIASGDPRRIDQAAREAAAADLVTLERLARSAAAS